LDSTLPATATFGVDGDVDTASVTPASALLVPLNVSPVAVGESLAAVTVTSRVCVLLAWLADWPSSTWNVTVRVVVFGVSDVVS
jgi:hypothetical protein